jgi:hypothetical protein
MLKLRSDIIGVKIIQSNKIYIKKFELNSKLDKIKFNDRGM